MIDQQRVAALIPAHNESGRIGKVLSVLQAVVELDEIIVIDDGSSDNTCAEVLEFATREPRLRCLSLPVNNGKSRAMFAGAAATQADILLFLDADLLGLQPEHIRSLIVPVCTGQFDMAVGVFRAGKFLSDLSHWATPWLSGQRCLRAQLFAQLPCDIAGYGVETSLTLTARKQAWRYRYIPWCGVWHPTSELRRGVWGGLLNRLKMYYEILKTIQQQHAWSAVIPVHFNRKHVLSLLVLLLLGASLGYNRLIDLPRHNATVLQSLAISDFQRILVIAPHPDDETLGAGGLIQVGLANSAQVRVAVVTNGDGQALGPFLLRFKMIPHAVDYIVGGETRQAETLAGMQVIGLPEAEVFFLGYPDHQLSQLWLDDWNTQCPLKAKYTRSWKSPYPGTFDPYTDYCGLSLLDDLHKLVADYKPDLVIVPHPNDDHPDHRAVSSFARLAIAELMGTEPGYTPQVLGYLVHYGSYPQPRGLHPTAKLLPPEPLSSSSLNWLQLDLMQAQTRAKIQSVEAYKSQIKLLRSFLPSFARQNEIFVQLPFLDLPVLGVSSLTLPAGDSQTTYQLPEPARESTRRLMVGGADLVGLQATRRGNQLTLSANTRGALLRELRYKLMVKLPDGRTLVFSYPGSAIRTGSNTFSANLNLSDLGNTQVLGFAAEVQEGVTLDRTGWHFIILKNPPWSG